MRADICRVHPHCLILRETQKRRRIDWTNLVLTAVLSGCVVWLWALVLLALMYGL